MDPSYKTGVNEGTIITPESEVVDHLLQLSKKRSVREEVAEEEYKVIYAKTE